MSTIANLNVRLLPVPGQTAGVDSLYGRSFRPSQGVLDLSINDQATVTLALMPAWVKSPPHCTTANRPTNGADGMIIVDDTLGKCIIGCAPFGDKIVAWLDPITGAQV